MQIRCFKCQMPIALRQDVIYSALDLMTDEDLDHYDVHCPRCRKMNRASMNQLKRAAPGWRREREEKTE